MFLASPSQPLSFSHSIGKLFLISAFQEFCGGLRVEIEVGLRELSTVTMETAWVVGGVLELNKHGRES
jgi:hypothetical protein